MIERRLAGEELKQRVVRSAYVEKSSVGVGWSKLYMTSANVLRTKYNFGTSSTSADHVRNVSYLTKLNLAHT
jgi:hypothetical protein